ncbi:hypothetical protein [Flaviflexus equikiangi]|uniref:Uncharacterized protein n=1 Tax=Flaviflexus equikiangi TaxID=2758573 RepID=A0ABS2TCI4_9ACTO|nr:hypothetical protein [Flaviflexus equikiangi]MBM9432355.1 hypothetical protein [Flaviflexus equikiangi]
MRNDDVIEQATRVLSRAWGNMATNDSLGRQRMLACALADAGLLARTPPSREQIAMAIYEVLDSQYGDFCIPDDAADAVLALMKGQDR